MFTVVKLVKKKTAISSDYYRRFFRNKVYSDLYATKFLYEFKIFSKKEREREIKLEGFEQERWGVK